MTRQPLRSTRPDTLVPYTTRSRSGLASSASSTRRRTIGLMPVTMSDVPRTAFRHDDRLQALPAHAGFQRRLRRNPPVARLVEIGQFAPVVHERSDARPLGKEWVST